MGGLMQQVFIFFSQRLHKFFTILCQTVM